MTFGAELKGTEWEWESIKQILLPDSPERELLPWDHHTGHSKPFRAVPCRALCRIHGHSKIEWAGMGCLELFKRGLECDGNWAAPLRPGDGFCLPGCWLPHFTGCMSLGPTAFPDGFSFFYWHWVLMVLCQLPLEKTSYLISSLNFNPTFSWSLGIPISLQAHAPFWQHSVSPHPLHWGRAQREQSQPHSAGISFFLFNQN